MIMKRIPAGIYAANCYIILDENTKESAVIDPGGDSDDLFKAVEEMGANVKAVLLTHGHIDHTGAVKDFIDKFNASLYLNKNDGELMLNDSHLFGSLKSSYNYIYINDKDTIKVGDTTIHCIHTPGHTPGGMCYKIGETIFTGDTLFLGSIGRTDFLGGNYDALINSIQSKLTIYEDSTVVYPGHGPSSTIGYEKKHNSFLR